MNDKLLDLAKLGYEAYAASSDWKNFQGNPMPLWDDLPQAIRNHWQAATVAIFEKLANWEYPSTSQSETQD